MKKSDAQNTGKRRFLLPINNMLATIIDQIAFKATLQVEGIGVIQDFFLNCLQFVFMKSFTRVSSCVAPNYEVIDRFVIV